MNEYIIVNKTTIEKRIKELEKEEIFSINNFAKIGELKQILSQSTPLVPVLEDAFDKGWDGKGEFWLDKKKKDYISNLKLDI